MSNPRPLTKALFINDILDAYILMNVSDELSKWPISASTPSNIVLSKRVAKKYWIIQWLENQYPYKIQNLRRLKTEAARRDKLLEAG